MSAAARRAFTPRSTHSPLVASVHRAGRLRGRSGLRQAAAGVAPTGELCAGVRAAQAARRRVAYVVSDATVPRLRRPFLPAGQEDAPVAGVSDGTYRHAARMQNILRVCLTAVRVFCGSPRHKDGGRTDRRGAASHCPPLRHGPPFLSTPSFPLRTPPPVSPHEWYMDRHAEKELCETRILIVFCCKSRGSMSKGRATPWRPTAVP